MTLYKNKYRIESTRLANWDYAANGWYFVTICLCDRAWHFGNIIQGKMQLSTIGQIAKQYWLEIPNHFNHVDIDVYVVMPNHVHGIIVINRSQNPVETRYIASLPSPNFASLQPSSNLTDTFNQFAPLKKGSLQAIIHAYKSSVTRWCRKNNHDDFAWQPRFYEHIIRQDGSLERIRQYIINNPVKWEDYKNKLANLWM